MRVCMVDALFVNHRFCLDLQNILSFDVLYSYFCVNDKFCNMKTRSWQIGEPIEILVTCNCC